MRTPATASLERSIRDPALESWLRLEFQLTPPGATPPAPKPASIKEAVVRWLNEKL